jgi:hypothetical protein
VRFYGEDALAEDALSEVRGRKMLFLKFQNEKIVDGVFKNEYPLFHFIHSKKRESFMNSLSSIANQSSFFFFDNKLLQCGRLIYILLFFQVCIYDFQYIGKRIIKKHLFARSSDQY